MLRECHHSGAVSRGILRPGALRDEEAVDERSEQEAEGDVEEVSHHAGADADGQMRAELIAENVGHGAGNAQRIQGHAAGSEHGEGSGIGCEIEHFCGGRGAHEAHAAR